MTKLVDFSLFIIAGETCWFGGLFRHSHWELHLQTYVAHFVRKLPCLVLKVVCHLPKGIHRRLFGRLGIHCNAKQKNFCEIWTEYAQFLKFLCTNTVLWDTMQKSATRGFLHLSKYGHRSRLSKSFPIECTNPRPAEFCMCINAVLFHRMQKSAICGILHSSLCVSVHAVRT